MKAAVCREFGAPLVVEEVTLRDPQPDEVLVRVAATAICHSDLHDIRGDFGGGLPFVGGHETAGWVEEVGASVTGVEPGDPVVVSLLETCGRCHYCLTGRPHLCLSKVTYDVEGTLTDQAGRGLIQKARVAGFAEQVLVHQSQVVKVPPEMPLDLACLLSCGVTTGFGAVVNRAQVRPLSSAVVIGVGGVGLNAIQGAVLCGATPIIAVDVIESKLTRAMAFGATHAVNAACNDAVRAVKELTEGRGADYVFVTVGSNAAMGQAIAMLAKRGTAVAVGLPPIADPAAVLPVADLVVNEKSIVGAFMGSIRPQVDIPGLAALYLAGRYKLDELISGRYPLERINEALDRSAQGEVLRNVIVFPRHVG